MRLTSLSLGIGLVAGLVSGCAEPGDPSPSSAMTAGGAAPINGAPGAAPNGNSTVSIPSTGGSARDSAALGSAGPPATLPGPPLDCPGDRTVLEQAAPATYSIVFEARSPQGPQPVFVATAFAIGVSPAYHW